MKGPLVSIVVPVYNSEAFLQETLDSVFALEYEPFEVIVVDDGSSDESAAIAQSYADVRCIRQENRGPADARNEGIRSARGEFVAFVDSDDVVLPHKLSTQVGYLLDHPDVTATLGRQVWISPPPDAVPDLVWGDLDGIPPLSLVIRKAALLEVGCFDPALRGPEDTDLLMRLREGEYQFVVLPEVVMRRRYHGRNLVAGHRAVGRSFDLLKAKLDRDRTRTAGDDAATSSNLISVLIPAYNAGLYLHEAIDSAFAQTHRPVEVIVVDDGSEDETRAVAERYGERIRFTREEHRGAGAARNTAVELATGEYLAFLDADDRFLPEKLERQLAALDTDPGLDMVFGHVREFVSPELPTDVQASIRPPAAPSPWTTPNLMLIRRGAFDRVGPFATELRVAETVDWYARAVEAGLGGIMLPEIVLERRLHPRNSGLRERDARSD